MSSNRVTIPEGHVAIVVPRQLAQELESYARHQREFLSRRKWAREGDRPVYGVLSDLQLHVSDALART